MAKQKLDSLGFGNFTLVIRNLSIKYRQEKSDALYLMYVK